MSDLVPNSMSARDLEAFLHQKIPLSRAMDVRVVESNDQQMALEAPLAANVNHLGTAFGGSLHALPTLACYATVWTIMREAGVDGHVVVKRSEANYRQPVKGPLRAICQRPTEAVREKFLSDLRRNKKARMEMQALIAGPDGNAAVEFHGTFVAFM